MAWCFFYVFLLSTPCLPDSGHHGPEFCDECPCVRLTAFSLPFNALLWPLPYNIIIPSHFNARLGNVTCVCQ